MTNYGVLTGDAVGIILKELIRRAMLTVQSKLTSYEITAKEGYDGRADLFTDADTATQDVYIKSLQETFPGYGIVGEESGVNIPCTLEHSSAFFVLDPIDGTKAFTRGQSHGIGSMIALVIDGQVVAAYVGDIMTSEIYGYRPDSNKVHRISRYETARRMAIDTNIPLNKRHVLLRERPEDHSIPGQTLIAREGPFRNIEIANGSIGISMARLWKDEVGAAIITPGKATLWDMCPVWGISQKLGLVFLRTDTLEEYRYLPDQDHPIIDIDHELLVIHHDYLVPLLAARNMG